VNAVVTLAVVTSARAPRSCGPAPPASRVLRIADATALRAALDPGASTDPPADSPTGRHSLPSTPRRPSSTRTTRTVGSLNFLARTSTISCNRNVKHQVRPDKVRVRWSGPVSGFGTWVTQRLQDMRDSSALDGGVSVPVSRVGAAAVRVRDHAAERHGAALPGRPGSRGLAAGGSRSPTGPACPAKRSTGRVPHYRAGCWSARTARAATRQRSASLPPSVTAGIRRSTRSSPPSPRRPASATRSTGRGLPCP
jgi:hypothetical protein